MSKNELGFSAELVNPVGHRHQSKYRHGLNIGLMNYGNHSVRLVEWLDKICDEVLLNRTTLSEALVLHANEEPILCEFYDSEAVARSMVNQVDTMPFEAVNAALENFLLLREQAPEAWDETAVRLTRDSLWKKEGYEEWVKRIYCSMNNDPVKGSSMMGLQLLAAYGSWHHDPCDFGFTRAAIKAAFESEYAGYCTTRELVDAMPFASEEAKLRWMLERPATQMQEFNFQCQCSVYGVERLKATLYRLKELGVSTDEYQGFEKLFWQKSLEKLQEKLENIAPTPESYRESIIKEIERISTRV